MKLSDIAGIINATVEGDERIDIRRVAKIEEASDGDVAFIANPKYAKFLSSTRASAVIVHREFNPEPGQARPTPALLRVDDPYTSFLKVLVALQPPKDSLPPGIHPTAVIASSVALGTGVRVGAHAVIGEGCTVGDQTMIGHGTILGDGVRIGSHSLLYANVTVREGCEIGSRVILHPGVVIGSDGFGFAPRPDGTYEKIPQVGIVVIEDDVEIGANTTVDRATMGETRIKRGVKLDNLIMVAHNVVIGENTVSAAQAGISGSTRVGRNVMIGGQVGFTGHIEIADHTKFGAQSGVHRSVHQPGKSFFGSPAYPQREAFRIQGAVAQLPDWIAAIRELQKKVELLEKEIQDLRMPHNDHKP